MKLRKFYNNFHKSSHSSFKIIKSNNFTYRVSLKVISKFIGNKPLKILDYGCGVGTISFYLANKKHNIVGVDISDKAIKVAKNSTRKIKLQKYLQFYTNEEFDLLKGKKYDVILLFEVIEHIKNDAELLKRLSKMLNKNGILILSTPSINAPLHKLGLARKFDESVGHLRRYNLEKLEFLINEQNKMKIIYSLKTEGIIRNSLYVFTPLGIVVRFLKGLLSNMVTLLDEITIPIFGESNIYVVAKKI